jgi:uncharacterized protein YdhG (YjbR/CyaY superfamily)
VEQVRRPGIFANCTWLAYPITEIGGNNFLKGFVMQEVKGTPANIDEYIAGFPEEVQDILVRIRGVIKESAPGAVEKISYGMPAFYTHGGLVWFGAYKRHIGLYPRTPEMDASIDGLSGYKGTKGSVHFPLDQSMPYELIRKIVKFRLAEIQKVAG